MKMKTSWAALSSLLVLGACEQASDSSAKTEKVVEKTTTVTAPGGQPTQPGTAAAADANAAQPSAPEKVVEKPAAPSPAALRDAAVKELTGKLDTATAKIDALKQKATASKKNKELKTHLTSLTSKLDAARNGVKALAASSEATFGEAKAKAEKQVQDLDASL